jgi:hypothetical protein
MENECLGIEDPNVMANSGITEGGENRDLKMLNKRQRR